VIRAMETYEIVAALRRAAQVCIEQDRSDWLSKEVCIADGTFHAANECLDDNDDDPRDPEHSAFFLLLVAEEANDGR
jgi:hypothetical protein